MTHTYHDRKSPPESSGLAARSSWTIFPDPTVKGMEEKALKGWIEGALLRNAVNDEDDM